MKWESTVISRWGWRKRFSNERLSNILKSGGEETSESRCSCSLLHPSSCNCLSTGRRKSSCCRDSTRHLQPLSSLEIQSMMALSLLLPLHQTHDTQPQHRRFSLIPCQIKAGIYKGIYKPLLWDVISWSILVEAQWIIWSLKLFTWLSGL